MNMKSERLLELLCALERSSPSPLPLPLHCKEEETGAEALHRSESSFVTKPGPELRSADSHPSALSTACECSSLWNTSSPLQSARLSQKPWNHTLVGQEYWFFFFSWSSILGSLGPSVVIYRRNTLQRPVLFVGLVALGFEAVLFFWLSSPPQYFCHPGMGSPFKRPSLEVCLGLLQLPEVPTVGLWGSVLQPGTDFNWLLAEMPFCNTDEWPREWNPVFSDDWGLPSVPGSSKNVSSMYLVETQFSPADLWLAISRAPIDTMSSLKCCLEGTCHI